MYKSNTKYVTYIGLLSAFAVIISYIESIIPINIGIPGIKPGFANIVIVIALYGLNIKCAILINLIRILIIGFMFGNLFSILFSIAGAVFSLIIMILIKKTNFFSMIGVSVCGGVSHNIAQILVASIIVNTYSIIYYAPALIIGGVITGVLIGVVSELIYKRIKSIFKLMEDKN